MIVSFKTQFGLFITGVYDAGTPPTKYDEGEPENFTILSIDDVETNESVFDEFSSEQIATMERLYIPQARNVAQEYNHDVILDAKLLDMEFNERYYEAVD